MTHDWPIRNAHWDETGGITLELNHPTLGWLPFTARGDDPEEHGRLIHAAGVRGDFPVVSAVPETEGGEADA